jgi:hypothetical protein
MRYFDWQRSGVKYIECVQNRLEVISNMYREEDLDNQADFSQFVRPDKLL